MSRLLITQYHAEVEKIIQYGGSRKETSIRIAFQNLLNAYCQQNVVNSFFTGKTKRNTFAKINSYYEVIKRTAVNIGNHREKQRFLKAVYENFYKAYNPKAADRLGIVYTPNEIVRFMVESVDYLTHKHFNKLLADPGVDILDPATGTGTFITELIEYLPKNKLKHKYLNEIHCNEVSILPYYIANLNIEYTYQQKMGEYEEFDNICFVDTLEHTSFHGKQMDLFALSVENTARIKRQNDKQISVIIGNPPYNAKQENFNDNNANRYYPEIDKRIKEIYIKQGTAQNQIVVYDMYTRFIRWATDRLNKNGIVAFITNSSFIDARTFDGFRKVVADEFSDIYIIDLGGNINGDKTGNIFNIRIGTAIILMIKNLEQNTIPCKIYYKNIFNLTTAEEKNNFISNTKINQIDFEHIIPTQKHNWINQTNNDFDELIPLIDKDVKAGKSEQAIFKLFSSGVKTQRDEWVYDFSRDNLEDKMRFAIDVYQQTLKDKDYSDKDKIKWDRELTKYLSKKISKEFLYSSIIKSSYRPYTSKYLYFDKHFNGMTYQWFNIWNNKDRDNLYIGFMGQSAGKPFSVIATNVIVDLNCISPASGGTQCLPLYSYDKSGNRVENITDWGLQQFQNYYESETITKQEIFYYVYAVLHNPEYKAKYEQNLKREFPRIPFYDNFRQWVAWGRQLMDLHINYETVEPYQLKRVNLSPKTSPPTPLLRGEGGNTRRGVLIPKVKLKADRDKGTITLDTDTSLHGVPPEAWEYKLGNRSAIEWVLDQYKEKKPRDKTIAQKFNNYRFADYKEEVIVLLQKVCTVSVETTNIIQQMSA